MYISPFPSHWKVDLLPTAGPQRFTSFVFTSFVLEMWLPFCSVMTLMEDNGLRMSLHPLPWISAVAGTSRRRTKNPFWLKPWHKKSERTMQRKKTALLRLPQCR